MIVVEAAEAQLAFGIFRYEVGLAEQFTSLGKSGAALSTLA